jgi:hypothetical protein
MNVGPMTDFDPEKASPEQIAKQFLKLSSDYMNSGGSYAIAYALIQRPRLYAETDGSVNGDILRLLDMNMRLRDRVTALEARLEAFEGKRK